MSRRRGSRSALLLSVVAATFGAATLPPPAAAEDEAPVVVAVPDVTAMPELEGAIDEVVEGALADAAIEAGPADVEDSPVEEVGELVPAPDAPAPTDVGRDPASTADSASTVALPSDTTADSPDTAADSRADAPSESDAGPPAAGAPAPQPSTSPAGQLNVNLSVRVASPGANGAVAQSNQVAPTATQPLAADTTRREQAAPATDVRPAATPDAAALDEWYWEWNCISTPRIGAISPPTSASGSMPSSWTWIWNCGDNSEQYQPGSTGQYQQINANISIRIDSPGDDGAVIQSNVVLAAPERVAVAIPQVNVPLPAIVLDTSFSVTFPAISRELAALPPLLAEVGAAVRLPSLGEILEDEGPWQTVAAEALQELEATLELTDGAAPEAVSQNASGSRHETLVGWAAIPPRPTAATGVVPAPTPVGSVASTWTPQAPASSALAGQASPPAEAKHNRPAPRWKPASGAPRSGGSPTSGATATVAGPGAAAGLDLPTFLALLLFAAVLDLARRVALERVTLPSGHWRRPPDTPG